MTTPRVYFTADLIVPDHSDTGVYGDPCEPGHGAFLDSGWIDLDWSGWTVYENQSDVSAKVYDPEETDLGRADWLAEVLSVLDGGVEDFDTTNLYAVDSYQHPRSGIDRRLAAHPEGFTDAEIEDAVRAVNAR